jgi:hypothetical protein
MRLIKTVLQNEIDLDYIKWPKLEAKIDAALNIVDNNFDAVRNDGVVDHIKMKDALTFRVSAYKPPKCIKLIQPRLFKGHYWCSGVQYGLYDLRGVPFFPTPALEF